jgi:predicted membrane channel-forming protein YqfA (hemolysin III family)
MKIIPIFVVTMLIVCAVLCLFCAAMAVHRHDYFTMTLFIVISVLVLISAKNEWKYRSQ